MPLMLVQRDKGRIGPAIICDHCGAEITDFEDGNAETGSYNLPAEIRFIHKKCAASAGKAGHWHEIGVTAFYLKNVLGITSDDWDRVEQNVRMLSEAGI